MGVLSNDCKLAPFGKSPFESTGLCTETNVYHHLHHVEEGTEEAATSSSISSASSTDLEELVEDSSDMVEAVQVLLHGLGEDVHRAGLIKTPLRVAHALAFATKGYRQVAKDLVGDALFPEAGVEVGSGLAGGLGGMVVVRSIDQFSLCRSCLLPFKVCCHIAYISSGYQVVGLSKLARVADMYARRLQFPHTLANQICQGLFDIVKPLGVAVAIQSWHLPIPGHNHAVSSTENVFSHPMVTFSGRGQFEDQGSMNWMYFLAMLRLEGISLTEADAFECNGLAKNVWCPCTKHDTDTADENHGLHPSGKLTYTNGNLGRLNGKNGVHDANTVNDNYKILGLPYTNGNSTYSNGNLGMLNGKNGFHCNSTLSSVSAKPDENFSAMVAAVEAIIDVLVKDTLKEDFHPTAKRFTRWLLHFRRPHQESELVIKKSCVNGMGSSIRTPSKSEYLVNSREVGHGSAVLVELDAPFCSLCEHHLLPFFGKAHIGYYASEATSYSVDRSIVLEIVEILGYKLQVQERLTREIAEALTQKFKLQSIIVVLEARHICMISRGVEKLGSSTATHAVLGHFASDDSAKLAFLEKIYDNRRVGRA